MEDEGAKGDQEGEEVTDGDLNDALGNEMEVNF
jgi:hypothetical protein